RGTDKFVAECAKRSDKVLGVGVEHEARAFCSISNVGSTNKVVNGTLVDEVEEGCCDKGAKHLGQPVGEYLVPGQFTAHGQRQCYGRIEVSAANCATHIDTQHDGKTPPQDNHNPLSVKWFKQKG